MSSWNLTEWSEERKVLSIDGVPFFWAFDLSLFLGPVDFFGAIWIKGVRILNWGFLEFESFESDWMWLGVIEGLENDWEWFSTKTLGERVRKIEREWEKWEKIPLSQFY